MARKSESGYDNKNITKAKSRPEKNKLLRKIIELISIVYLFSYCSCLLIGLITIRFFIYRKIEIKSFLKASLRGIKKALEFVIKMLLLLFGVIGRFFIKLNREIVVSLRHAGRVAARHGYLVAIRDFIGAFTKKVFHKRYVAFKLANYIAPIIGAVVLIVSVRYFTSLTFALEVQFNGEPVGVISDENSYEIAQKMMQERINYDGQESKIELSPNFALKVVDPKKIMTVDLLCDEIITNSSDEITSATGLYVDDKFYGAVTDPFIVQQTLNSMLDKYRTGNPNEKVSFIKKVELKPGLYPTSAVEVPEKTVSLVTSENMGQKKYTIVKGDSPNLISRKNDVPVSELERLNPELTKKMFPNVEILIAKSVPFLPVSIKKHVVYNQETAFPTVEVKDGKYNIGYTNVAIKGANGEEQIEADVTMLDGVEIERSITKRTTAKEPVAKKVVIGTYKPPNYIDTSKAGASGRFMWPVNGGSISCGFMGYYGHTGTDIIAHAGTAIYASDSGVVVTALYTGRGYGRYIVIDHGNGYRTLYGHCSILYVKAGDRVVKGQTIAGVGATGNASGNHLHFEIQINGRAVNAAPYIR